MLDLGLLDGLVCKCLPRLSHSYAGLLFVHRLQALQPIHDRVQIISVSPVQKHDAWQGCASTAQFRELPLPLLLLLLLPDIQRLRQCALLLLHRMTHDIPRGVH